MKAIPVQDCSYCAHLKTYEIQVNGAHGIHIEKGHFCSIAPMNRDHQGALNSVHASQIVPPILSMPDWCPLPDMK